MEEAAARESVLQRPLVPTILLVITLISTAFAGSIFAHGYFGGSDEDAFLDVLFSARWVALGFIYFGLPLVFILFVHEIGHYLVMKRLGLRPSLPIFIPVPPPLNLSGTFGAVIALKEVMPDRRSLVTMAAAGPLAGVVAAVLVLIGGLALTNAQPPIVHEGPIPIELETNSSVTIQTPFIYDWVADSLAVDPEANVHPLAFAGFWGFFLTSIQLFPAGQLDGGHIARGILGANAKYLSWATIAAMFALGLAGLAGFPSFPGYAVLGVIVLLTGATHPPPANDAPQRDGLMIALGVACLVVFALTFVPVPLSG